MTENRAFRKTRIGQVVSDKMDKTIVVAIGYRRIDLRVSIMLEQGLLEEIKALLASGIPASCTAMQAIGYKEFVETLNGNCTIEEAADLVRQSSRRYAKRQLTWLRRNEKIHWLTRRTGQSSEEILAQARRVILDFDN